MISLLPMDGSTFDITDWWFRFTLDTSTDYLLGQSVASLINPQVAFAHAFARVQAIQSDIFRLGGLWWLYKPREFIQSINVLNEFFKPYIDTAVSHGEKGGSTFLNALSEYTHDKQTLRDQLVNTLLAARDTTAATLSWLCYELSYNPDKYAKLRSEVLSVLGTDRQPTYEELKNMKYLQWCINESISALFRAN
jgi:cytochrome P450